MSKLYVKLKGDNKENVKRLISTFFKDGRNRKIDITEDGVIILEIQVKAKMNTSIFDAIASSEIITLSYDGFEVCDVATPSKKREQHNDNEYEQIEFFDVDNELDVNSEESLKEFNIEEFAELKDIIRNAETEDKLAEKISVFFDISDNEAVVKFKKLFITSLSMLKLTWEGIDSRMDEKITKYEKVRYSNHINGILKKYGYNSTDAIDVVKQVGDYYKSCNAKFKLPCMQGVKSFEKFLTTINLRLGNTEKMKLIFDFMCTETGSIPLSKKIIIYALVTMIDIETKKETDLKLEMEIDMQSILNRFLRKNDKNDVEVLQFLKELRETGIFTF